MTSIETFTGQTKKQFTTSFWIKNIMLCVLKRIRLNQFGLIFCKPFVIVRVIFLDRKIGTGFSENIYFQGNMNIRFILNHSNPILFFYRKFQSIIFSWIVNVFSVSVQKCFASNQISGNTGVLQFVHYKRLLEENVWPFDMIG